jgi:glucokinase
MADNPETFTIHKCPDKKFLAGLSVGVDWGGSNLRAGLVSFEENTARILEWRQIPWNAGVPPQAAAAYVAGLVRHKGEESKHGTPAALGVGLASMVNPKTGQVMNAPNLGWEVSEENPLDLAKMLEQATSMPVALHNDLSAIAWGERCFGAGRGADHMLCVFLGTGMGASFIGSGKLVEGHSGVAVELGHLRLKPGGTLCGCGQRGCVEAYVGGRHIEERLKAELAEGGPGKNSAVLQLAGGNPASAHAGHLDEAARNGDLYASDLVDEISSLLATALAYGVTLFDPGLLVMGGTVWEGCPELKERTVARLSLMANPPAAKNLAITDAVLGDRAGVLGAAALALAKT